MRATKTTGRIHGRLYQFDIGNGAGYKGGLTAYMAIDCLSRKQWRKGKSDSRRLFQVGITRNANVIPLPRN